MGLCILPLPAPESTFRAPGASCLLPCAEGPQRPGCKSSPAAHGAESKPVILSGQVGRGQLFLRALDPEGWNDAGWPPFLLGGGRVQAAPCALQGSVY